MKIIAPIKVEWLTMLIDIIDLDTWDIVNTWTMTEISYGHYSYEFEWYVQWKDYFIKTIDNTWVYEYDITTWDENLVIDKITSNITDKIDSIDWSVWTNTETIKYLWGWSWWDVYWWISIEQLNWSMERILWEIERAKQEIKEDITSTKSDMEWLVDILADIDTAMNLDKKWYLNVNIDYDKIISRLNEIKWSSDNDDIKAEILKLYDKLDAYKQLDISDIIDTIEFKLNNKIDESNKEIILSIKNNFKDLNNKIKDLKEFNDKINISDRTKVIEDTYKILENIESTWLSDILDKLNRIDRRVTVMHEDIDMYIN